MNTENEFIAILAEPYFEDKVAEVLEKYEIPKEEPEEDESIFFSNSKSGFLALSFDNECETDKQKSMREQANFYVQGIEFNFGIKDKETMDTPFNINEEDTYNTIKEKLGHADFQDDDYEESDPMYRKIWELKKEDGTIYDLVCRFYSNTLKIESMSLLPHNKDVKYEVVKNELLP